MYSNCGVNNAAACNRWRVQGAQAKRIHFKTYRFGEGAAPKMQARGARDFSYNKHGI